MRIAAASTLLLGLLLTACQQSVFDLEIGQCINVPTSGEVSTAEVVECSEPHDAEVFALPQHPPAPTSPFPGTTEIGQFAKHGVPGGLRAVRRHRLPELRAVFSALQPTQETWDQADDREVACLLVGENGAQSDREQAGQQRVALPRACAAPRQW